MNAKSRHHPWEPAIGHRTERGRKNEKSSKMSIMSVVDVIPERRQSEKMWNVHCLAVEQITIVHAMQVSEGERKKEELLTDILGYLNALGEIKSCWPYNCLEKWKKWTKQPMPTITIIKATVQKWMWTNLKNGLRRDFFLSYWGDFILDKHSSRLEQSNLAMDGKKRVNEFWVNKYPTSVCVCLVVPSYRMWSHESIEMKNVECQFCWKRSTFKQAK